MAWGKGKKHSGGVKKGSHRKASLNPKKKDKAKSTRARKKKLL
jgi:hypothetical protein